MPTDLIWKMYLNRDDKTSHQKSQAMNIYKNIRNTKSLDDNDFLKKMNILKGMVNLNNDPIIQKINLAHLKAKNDKTYYDWSISKFDHIKKELESYKLAIIMRRMNKETYEQLDLDLAVFYPIIFVKYG